ncbi:hypothetical protein C5Y97_11170 [Blastopirellula marina]|uniref:Uncharacterized protein n=1 Tax=Blastopirellula marina TaxID=124 RepID=A0A2S8G2C7_9BACT|nr:hypothetical protein C5Y98_11160 [Blastopirellula marina]PTL45255.1 hypothetical protein C5Y97_11170 [Blastopirellula marina]
MVRWIPLDQGRLLGRIVGVDSAESPRISILRSTTGPNAEVLHATESITTDPAKRIATATKTIATTTLTTGRLPVGTDNFSQFRQFFFDVVAIEFARWNPQLFHFFVVEGFNRTPSSRGGI